MGFDNEQRHAEPACGGCLLRFTIFILATIALFIFVASLLAGIVFAIGF